MTMNTRKMVVGAIVALIGLPVVLVVIVAVSVSVLTRTNGTLVSSDQKRDYLLYVPSSYDRATPTPLVISLHGAAGWPAQQRNLSRWNRLAESQGFLVVYPSGSGMPRTWRTMPGDDARADVRFLADVIDTLGATYNIDPARIYADGLSNGGGMTFALSCALSDRIAAVGMVAAAHALPWSWCADSRPVPVIMFHGTADRITPYHGGRTWISPVRFPSIPAWSANWARRNHCGPDPVESVVAADVTRLEYTHCADDAAVVLYTVQGGGHTWPGGGPLPEWFVGPTSRNIDATRQMWAFFREHPRQ